MADPIHLCRYDNGLHVTPGANRWEQPNVVSNAIYHSITILERIISPSPLHSFYGQSPHETCLRNPTRSLEPIAPPLQLSNVKKRTITSPPNTQTPNADLACRIWTSAGISIMQFPPIIAIVAGLRPSHLPEETPKSQTSPVQHCLHVPHATGLSCLSFISRVYTARAHCSQSINAWTTFAPRFSWRITMICTHFRPEVSKLG
jgi:hypothetical protein